MLTGVTLLAFLAGAVLGGLLTAFTFVAVMLWGGPSE